MNRGKAYIVLALIAVFSFGFSKSDDSMSLPGSYTLFKIDRSKDPDVVMYDVNLDSKGRLNTANPISVYWKKNSSEGQLEPLTEIQRKLGYGLRFQYVNEDMAEFCFISNIDRTFELRRSGDNSFRVFTISQGIKVELQRMYVHFGNDSFWLPSISSIDIYGIEKETGSLVSENILP